MLDKLKLTDRYTWEEIVNRSADKLEKLSKEFNRKGFSEWMLKKEKIGYCFDYLMYYRCFLIKKKYLDRDFDYLIVICGGEGIGKSTLAIQIASVISESEFKSNHICIDAEQFLEALENANEYDVLVADEGAFFLFSKDANTRSSKIVTKILTIIRQKRLCVIVNSVNYFLLDNYLRNHRTRLLIQIRNRGKYRQINKKGIMEICTKAWKTKNVMGVRMRATYFHDGYWNKVIPPIFDFDNYLMNKKNHMDNSIKEARLLIKPKEGKGKIDELLAERPIKVSRIMKTLGQQPKGNVKHFVEYHHLNAKKMGYTYFISEKEAEDFINKYKNNHSNF